MNISKNNNKYRYIWKIFAALLVLVIVSCSITIDSINQPGSVNGGQILPVTLNVTLNTNSGQTNRFMVAVLVPTAWKVSNNSVVTFTSDITSGPQSMSVIPAGTAAPQGGGLDWPTLLSNKIGNGGNLLSGWEWVAFYSNASYTVGSNATIHITVNIQIKVSNDNLMFKLGYVVGNDSNGLSDAQYYNAFFSGNCFTVVGTGDLIDFCNPQISTVEPRTSLENDIVTISYDGGVTSTLLDNASQIYLCATGILTDGTSITVCTPNTQTMMSSLGLKKWRKDIWPRKYFGLTDTQHLTSFQYFFTDVTGNQKVGYGGGSSAFNYTFKCQ
jgi:hypothetical protein